MSTTTLEQEILQKISDIASLTGIKGEIVQEKNQFEAGFNLGNGRSQLVYVRPTGKSGDGSPVITFFSPCLHVKSGFLKGISKEQALDLLRQNQQLMFARYGIWKWNDGDLIVASVDQLLDTLDPKEFESHMWCVAIAADAYEKSHGGGDAF